MELIDRIRKFAEANITDPNQFLVEVVLTARSGPKKVVLIIDGDHGINIDDCTNLSRAVGTFLEEGNLIDDQYTLEVSTPGLDHPLKLKRQYYKNIGRSVKAFLKDKSMVIGTLTKADENEITLTIEVGEGKKKETKEITLTYLEIEKTIIQVSFK